MKSLGLNKLMLKNGKNKNKIRVNLVETNKPRDHGNCHNLILDYSSNLSKNKERKKRWYR